MSEHVIIVAMLLALTAIAAVWRNPAGVPGCRALLKYFIGNTPVCANFDVGHGGAGLTPNPWSGQHMILAGCWIHVLGRPLEYGLLIPARSSGSTLTATDCTIVCGPTPAFYYREGEQA